MNPIYGQKFYDLRKTKKISLGELSHEILSVSMITKFEKGINSLSVEKLFDLLIRMNVTIDEYYSLVHDVPYHTLHLELEKINQQHLLQDPQGLQQLQDSYYASYQAKNLVLYRHLAIVAEVFKNALLKEKTTSSEIDYLSEYLLKMPDWSKYELLLVQALVVQLPLQFAMTAKNLIINRKSDFTTLPTNAYIAKEILINLISILFEGGHYVAATEVLQQTRVFNTDSRDFYVPTLLNYFEGLLLIANGQVNQGTILATQAIDVMTFVGQDQFAAYFQADLDEILEKFSIA